MGERVMDQLLVIWTARNIQPALAHFHALDTRKVWVHGHNETEVAEWMRGLVEGGGVPGLHDHTLISLVPDDVILSQYAYDAIVGMAGVAAAFGHAASGWTNLDFVSPQGTVMTSHVPPLGDGWLDVWSIPQIVAHPGPHIEATWTGMCCHTMPAWMWREHPIVPHYSPPGCASDHALALSLQAAERKIWVPPTAMLTHLKVDHTLTDTGDAWKQLDLTDKRVVWE